MDCFTRTSTLFVLLLSILISEKALSCSRILHTNNQQTIVGRTMDWSDEMNTNLFVYPKGILRYGTNDDHPLQWTSQYGSLVCTSYKNITTDGLNERGLAAHMLELSESTYGKRNIAIPGIDVINWAQFYLDNFATVAEAVRYTESNLLQIVAVFMPETNDWVTLHLALEDTLGDSAIIEYIQGKAIIYHDPSYAVLTNSPVYNQQLENLRNYKGFGGNKPLPGTTKAKDRFVRAAFYTLNLPTPTSLREELSNVLAVLRNVSQPNQKPTNVNMDISRTQWRSIIDLTHLVYYFDDSNRTALIWARLDEFNLSSGAPILKLDLVNHEYTGDVTKEFQAV
jgi:choloylglycine hydrolase